MAERAYWLVLGVLAVWRVSHLLHAEDGPWGLLANLRRLAGEGFWGELLDCFHCLSLWVAAPFAAALADGALELVLLWLALSAAAILVQRVAEPTPVPAAPWVEDPEP